MSKALLKKIRLLESRVLYLERVIATSGLIPKENPFGDKGPFEIIMRIVCTTSEISMKDVLNKKRLSEPAARARHLIWYFARIYRLGPGAYLASKLNRKNPSTVAHAFKKISDIKDIDCSEQQQYLACKAAIEKVLGPPAHNPPEAT